MANHKVIPETRWQSPLKNPIKVKAGTIGAVIKRWGPEPRVVRLDELTDPRFEAVLNADANVVNLDTLTITDTITVS